MFEDEFSPQRMVQRVGDFFEQRKAYRLAALLALRWREGLPSPVDEQGNPLETRMDDYGSVTYHDADGKQVNRVLFAGAGRNGKSGSFATGTMKGAPLVEAQANWNRVPAEDLPLHLRCDERERAFQILEVAEDGRKLVDEMADLHRDSATYERAERVSHGPAGEQAPDLVLDGTSDEEVDARLQEYLRRGKQ